MVHTTFIEKAYICYRRSEIISITGVSRSSRRSENTLLDIIIKDINVLNPTKNIAFYRT